MKKKISILALVIIVVILSSLSLSACSFITDRLKTVNVVNLNADELKDENLATAVAQTAVQSCVRVNTTFNLAGTKITSSGAGFIITSDGYVITNRHVVAVYIESQLSTKYSLKRTNTCQTLFSASTFLVAFADSNDAYQCDLVAYSTDPNLDLAILKITAPSTEYIPLSIDKESKVTYGQTAYTFGNPENIGLVFTSLMISNPAVKINSSTNYDSILLDGNINHGNSGGALIDDKIHVIGVVFARVESNEASANTANDVYGIGCAVSANDLVAYIEGVKQTRGVSINYTLYSEKSSGVEVTAVDD